VNGVNICGGGGDQKTPTTEVAWHYLTVSADYDKAKLSLVMWSSPRSLLATHSFDVPHPHFFYLSMSAAFNPGRLAFNAVLSLSLSLTLPSLDGDMCDWRRTTCLQWACHSRHWATALRAESTAGR
jgi:hypothetical protein